MWAGSAAQVLATYPRTTNIYCVRWMETRNSRMPNVGSDVRCCGLNHLCSRMKLCGMIDERHRKRGL